MQANNPLNVIQYTPKNPYREFAINIPAGQSVTISYATNTFRALSLSQNTLAISFMGSQKTTFAGVGVGIIYPAAHVYGSVTLFNTDAVNALTGTICLGVVADISDTRSAVQTSITVLPQTKIITYPDVAVGAGAAVKVMSANILTNNVTISNLLANNTVVRYGDSATSAAQGAELGIGAQVNLSNTADIWVFNPSAAGINIGVMAQQ